MGEGRATDADDAASDAKRLEIPSHPAAQVKGDVPVGIWAAAPTTRRFLQHLGVPSSDVSSSVLTAFITRFSTTSPGSRNLAIRTFVYEQQMARVFGLEAVRMAMPMFCPMTTRNTGRR